MYFNGCHVRTRRFHPGFAVFAEFGPWGRKRRFFEAGEVRLALLSLLAEGPSHGYDLMKAMAERSGGLYQASAGTIYPSLQQLEDEGLVVSESRDGKKVYRLTESGQRELDARAVDVERIWQRAGTWQEWGRFLGPEIAELAGPLRGLVRAAFEAARRSEEGARKARDILERTRDELELLLKR